MNSLSFVWLEYFQLPFLEITAWKFILDHYLIFYDPDEPDDDPGGGTKLFLSLGAYFDGLATLLARPLSFQIKYK